MSYRVRSDKDEAASMLSFVYGVEVIVEAPALSFGNILSLGVQKLELKILDEEPCLFNTVKDTPP